jgi:replicative DNA helicase
MIAGNQKSKFPTIGNIEHQVPDGTPTGFPTLDRAFGGFSLGHLTILGGRTSKGKTALAVNTALNLALSGSPVLYLTLEIPSDEVFARALGCLGQLNIFEARRCGLSAGKRRLKSAQAQIENSPLRILFRPSMRPRGNCGSDAKEQKETSAV